MGKNLPEIILANELDKCDLDDNEVSEKYDFAPEISGFRLKPEFQVKDNRMQPLSAWRKEVENQPIEDDLIQGLLPVGSTEYMMLCGRAGMGKTNLILHLAFSMATGSKWFDFQCKQCKVGYLGFEGTRRKLLDRIDKLQLSFPDPGDNLLISRSLPFKLFEDGIDKLCTMMESLEVIIIDPLRYIVPFDYTKPVVASHFIAQLKESCAETDTVPILVHHVRKRDRRLRVKPENLIDEVRGASDYVDAAATVMLLENATRKRNDIGQFARIDDDRELHFSKVKDSPAEISPYKLMFDRQKLMYFPLTGEDGYSADE